MFRTGLIACAAAALATGAQAQVPTERATTPPRAGPSLALALEAVQAAVSACAAKDYNGQSIDGLPALPLPLPARENAPVPTP